NAPTVVDTNQTTPGCSSTSVRWMNSPVVTFWAIYATTHRSAGKMSAKLTCRAYIPSLKWKTPRLTKSLTDSKTLISMAARCAWKMPVRDIVRVVEKNAAVHSGTAEVERAAIAAGASKAAAGSAVIFPVNVGKKAAGSIRFL